MADRQGGMTEKLRRKQFLNDFCKAFGMDRADSRRSQAGKIYIEFGEEHCRAWLKKSNHSYRSWVSLVQSAKRKQLASGEAATKSTIRKSRQPQRPRIPEDVKRQTNLARHKALVERGQRKSAARERRVVEQTAHNTGAKQINASSDGTVLPQAKKRKKSKRKRRSESRQRAAARQAAALKQISRFSKPRRGSDIVNASIRDSDPKSELAILLKQLDKVENQGDRASEFKQNSLKERIALLEAEIKSPKL